MPLTARGRFSQGEEEARDKMQTDIQSYQGSQALLPSDGRRAGRAISRYEAQGRVRVAGMDVETDVSLAKVDSLTAVTGQAMGAVVRVAQGQKHLEQLAPESSGRLAMLADDHALGLMDVTSDHRRALRRK